MAAMAGPQAIDRYAGGWCLAGRTRSAGLQAGVGRADITPPTGYYMMGWVRSDGIVKGQHTRLYARAIVLKQGAQKIALVAEDLNGIPGGVLAAAADSLKAYGFSERNVLDSGVAHPRRPIPVLQLRLLRHRVHDRRNAPTQQNVSGAIDPQLYAFEVRQLAAAIRKADNDLGPARAAWGHTELVGLTQNRSLEAHLADFGIFEAYGTGQRRPGPGRLRRHDRSERRRAARGQAARRARGLRHGANGAARPAATARGASCAVTTVPEPTASTVRSRPSASPSTPRRRASPRRSSATCRSAMWSTFADHGTVNKFTFGYYNGDHHAAAIRVTEAAMRSAGNVPSGQDVVNAYGNSDEGDMTAGIAHTGPADAEWVGRQEAGAMLTAWRQAGQHLSSSVALDERWTRTCFCGQATEGGSVGSKAVFGLPQLTGSEEGRGPLYDLDHVVFEDMRLVSTTRCRGTRSRRRSPRR